MGTKFYAPVIIVTLDRVEHFKRCLESLEECTGAENTDVYVALDYPPSEKYIAGWEKNNVYISEKETNHHFKSFHVLRRERNYGICKKNGNFESLINDLRDKYNCFISSEDDNYFSKNFLEYMNWGLNEFKDDNRVFAIGGYNEVDLSSTNYNVFAYPRFSAWGCGMWFDRYDKVALYYEKNNVLNELKNTSFFEIFGKQIEHHAHLLGMIGRGEIWFDSIVGCLPENERFMIMPTLNKVKNYGMDGSGQHGKGSKAIIAKHINMTIDENSHFCPEVKQPLFDISDLKVFFDNHYSTGHDYKLRIKSIIVFALWKLFRINVYSFIA